MSEYFDNSDYFKYLLDHCTGDIPVDGEGRMAGARQLEFFLDRLSIESGQKVLEVGCGTGRIMQVLASRFGVSPFGVDPCSEAIDFLKQKRPDWAGQVKYTPDGVLTGLAGEAFDKVIFWGVFELTDQLRTLLEVSRAARPGAQVLLNSVRNATFLDDDAEMVAAVEAYEAKEIPIQLTQIDRFEDAIQFLGFTIEERYVFHKKGDVILDRFELDRNSQRFAEATYILTKSKKTAIDSTLSATAFAKPAGPFWAA